MKTKPASLPTRLPVATTAGDFIAEYTGQGLSGLSFPRRTGAKSNLAETKVPPPEIRRWHVLTTKAVKAALAGKPLPLLPPLDLARGSAFQQSVWRKLQQIAAGRTQSYGEVAATLGRPKATRAVGTACGANPIPLLVPCHRVLAARGGLGGFTAGLDWKRLLLEREGSLP